MEPISEPLIEMEPMSIDQFAGSVVLILGAVGSLLLVVWQSRCGIHCRLGCSDTCYICDCKRDPPPSTADEDPDEPDERPVAQYNQERDRQQRTSVEEAEQVEELVPTSDASRAEERPGEPAPEPEISN